MKTGIYCEIPFLDSNGQQVGTRYARCETSADILLIEDELANIGMLAAKKVHFLEGEDRVTFLDEMVISSVDFEDADTIVEGVSP